MKRTPSRYSRHGLAAIFKFNRDAVVIAEENQAIQEAYTEVVQDLLGKSKVSLFGLASIFSNYDSSWILKEQYPTSVDLYRISRKHIKK